MSAPATAHRGYRHSMALMASVLVLGAFVFVPATRAAASTNTVEISWSPANPTTSDSVSVTVWVDCTAGSPLIQPSLYYYVSGPATYNNYMSTSWQGTRATATVTLGNLAAGNYAVYGYGRDSSFNQGNCLPSSYDFSNSPILTMTVGQAKLASATGLVSSDPAPHVGDSVTFTATVTGGSTTPTGTVTFTDGATTLGTATLSSGQATYTTTALTAGDHSLVASYGGNTTYNTSASSTLSLTVGKLASATGLVSSDPAPHVGDSVTFTATVTGGSTTPTGTVTFTDGATTLGTATLSSGQATYTTTALTAGDHSLVASYGGNTTYNTSASSTLSLTVGKLASATGLVSSDPAPHVGDSVTFTATVTGGSTTPTGTVTFTDGATTLGTATLSSGQATYTTTALTAGDHSLVASYGGNTTYNTSASSTLSLTVGKLASATGLVSSDPAPHVGDSVTFTATVTGGSTTPTGTVTFTDGATTLGTATLSSGQATYTTTALTAGDHSLVASYGGNTTYNTSASSTLSLTVGKLASATGLVSSDPAPHVGDSVTFTATVTGGSTTPTGTVTFTDGATTLGTATLSSGQATYTTTALTAGDHTITATYAGTASLLVSHDAVTIAVALPESTTLVLTVDPESGPIGGTFTLTATVSPSAATGTVTFTADGEVLGTAVLSSGIAVLEVDGDEVAGAALAAEYGGATGWASARVNGTSASVEGVLVDLDDHFAGEDDEIRVGGSGFAPGSSIELWLHSEPVLLGTISADLSGRFATTVTLPAGVTGEHEIHALGTALSGDTLEAATNLTIIADQLSAIEELPYTGGGPSPIAPIGLILIMVGGLAMAVQRVRSRMQARAE